MKIGFHLTGGDRWRGGTSHLEVFLQALRQHFSGRVKLCLLVPEDRARSMNGLGQVADEIVTISALRRWTLPWILDRTSKQALARDWLNAKMLRRREIDAVFGLCMPYRYSDIPTLSWVYDFQHVHLPEMFSRKERITRAWAFSQTARRSTRIIVMSEAVKKDFQRSYPSYAHKVRAVKTATYVPPSIYESDPKSVTSYYQLPEKFVYLPNQFWRHKNHGLVFNAVKLLKGRGVKTHVVCSGHQGDTNHPLYFADLLRQIADWEIGDQISLLGLVPRHHVFQLMRQSVCVVNPSLFEGFGLSVDEARSTGKKILLSDIPAHREQDVPQGMFFDPRNVEDLAEKLKRIWWDSLPGPDRQMELEARENLPRRLATCAESFIAVVLEVAAKRLRER
jgi:glycosyltransferase involved in cell wall biosynthesis